MDPLQRFLSGYEEEPGYFDYASFGPLSRSVTAESDAWMSIASRARFGASGALFEQDARARRAVGDMLGIRPDQVVLQPNTTTGIMQVMFGLTGPVLLSRGEFPTLPVAAVRAEQALQSTGPIWLETDEHGLVTPGQIREQLTSTTTAVAVSLVDSRTGYLVDLEGIREVIGDRLLIVDAIQGAGVVDAPYEVADVVAGGGQKWLRAGWSTGYLALSDRAVDQLTPALSGWRGEDEDEIVWDEVRDPLASPLGYRITNLDPIAAARLAAACEDVESVGVQEIGNRIAVTVSRVIDLADEFALPVASPRNESERAGIVVLDPPADRLTALTAGLFNHGITATTRQGRVRLAVHAGTSEESLDMLRAAFTSYASTFRF